MRTLVRRIEDALYFGGPDRWTSNASEALNFKSIDRALDFIRRWELKDVELAFAFEEEESVTTVTPEKLEINFSED